MTKIDRDDIQLLSRHSNLSEADIDKMLKQEIYNSKESWQKFLKLLFMSLGVSFTTAGIVFFFAYNWADLNKFAKIFLIEGLIVVLTSLVLFSKISLEIKNIILTGASILVGVLMAVFGQIYQTGANAYDLFLGWTLFIMLWVIIANYSPLWLIFIVLINTSLVLYSQQVAHDWSVMFIFTLLFIINTLFLAASLFRKQLSGEHSNWFPYIIALAIVTIATVGIGIGMFDKINTSFFVLLVMVSILYAIGIWYGLKTKNSFYLAIVPFSIIIIISIFLIKLTDNAFMFFFISFFVIGSVSFVIKTLIDLQKKWRN